MIEKLLFISDIAKQKATESGNHKQYQKIDKYETELLELISNLK